MHTKGPWKVKYEYHDRWEVFHDMETYQPTIAFGPVRVNDPTAEERTGEANARLIASVPDMLEILEAIKAMVDNGACCNISGDSIHRVIRKAKGE